MNDHYSDPITDAFVRKFALGAGILFVIIAIIGAAYKAGAIVLVSAFGGGAFLMLAWLSYTIEQRLNEYREKERFKRLPTGTQIDIQLQNMR